MTTSDDRLRFEGLGLSPPPAGAALYRDEANEVRVALILPEEEAVQFVLDGLGVRDLGELRDLVERGRGTL